MGHLVNFNSGDIHGTSLQPFWWKNVRCRRRRSRWRCRIGGLSLNARRMKHFKMMMTGTHHYLYNLATISHDNERERGKHVASAIFPRHRNASTLGWRVQHRFTGRGE